MRLIVDGQPRQLVVRPGKDGVDVTLDGRSLGVALRALGAGVFELAGAGRERFHVVRDGDTVFVHWRGRGYELRLEREGARAAQRHAAGGLETPMPGKVIKVSVSPGDLVRKGQEILVVEAMKMENQIRAPRDGRVKSVAARPGDMVGPGLVLAEIE